MKLGIAYNVFDGEELLEGSIVQIRHIADYIVALVQTISNHGNEYFGGYDECIRLAQLGLIDEVVIVHTTGQSAGMKEKAKRQIGVNYCTAKGCNIMAHMDCDEYYHQHQFKAAYERFAQSNFTASACLMQTYYKKPTLKLNPPEEYYVPLFHRVSMGDGMVDKYPVYSDPTRRMQASKFLPFTRNEIEMHHFSFVRHNIRRKLENSSARRNFERDIDKHVNQWFAATENSVIDYFGTEKRLIECENLFDITV